MANPRSVALHICYEAEEEIDEDYDVYLLTCSPNPNVKGRKSQPLHKQYASDIYNVLADLDRCCCTFCVVPELNKNGQIHYHGWFQVTDYIKYYKSTLRKLTKLGFCKIVIAKDYKKALKEYYKKDIDIYPEVYEPMPPALSHLNMRNTLRVVTRSQVLAAQLSEIHKDMAEDDPQVSYFTDPCTGKKIKYRRRNIMACFDTTQTLEFSSDDDEELSPVIY